MFEIIIAAVSLFFTVGITIGGTTWALSKVIGRIEARLVESIARHELEDAERFALVHAKIAETASSLSHNFGDTGRALREKLHELELNAMRGKAENLDTFVRRESFFKIVDGFNSQFNAVSSKLDLIAAYRREELSHPKEAKEKE